MSIYKFENKQPSIGKKQGRSKPRVLLRLPALGQSERKKPDTCYTQYPSYHGPELPVRKTARRGYGKRLGKAQTNGRVREDMGKRKIRSFLRGKIRFKYPHSHQKYPRYQRCRNHQCHPGKAQYHFRKRLWQTQGTNIPHRSYGRHHP